MYAALAHVVRVATFIAHDAIVTVCRADAGRYTVACKHLLCYLTALARFGREFGHDLGHDLVPRWSRPWLRARPALDAELATPSTAIDAASFSAAMDVVSARPLATVDAASASDMTSAAVA